MKSILNCLTIFFETLFMKYNDLNELINFLLTFRSCSKFLTSHACLKHFVNVNIFEFLFNENKNVHAFIVIMFNLSIRRKKHVILNFQNYCDESLLRRMRNSLFRFNLIIKASCSRFRVLFISSSIENNFFLFCFRIVSTFVYFRTHDFIYFS